MPPPTASLADAPSDIFPPQAPLAAKLVAATRPAFLSITALGVLLGFALAWQDGFGVAPAVMLLAFIGALCAHAAANTLNDVHDAASGCDAGNTERLFPFTGGSRFIQNGTLSAATMQRLAWALFAVAALCGIVLLTLTDRRLLGFGLFGLFLGIAYSVPPLKLMARGLGEIAVAVAWLLIVAGSDFVLRQQLEPAVWLAGAPFAVQIALILLANQVPDCTADAAVGKRNWVVRRGRAGAAPLYRGLVWLSFGLLLLAVWQGALPALTLPAVAALPLGLAAGRLIERHHDTPAELGGAIRLTLLSAHLLGLALIAGLVADRLL